MRRLLCALLLVLGLTGVGAAQRIPDGAFVRVRGGAFVVGGRPFTFLGANFDPIHGARARARARDLIAALRADHMTVGRIWALGEGDKSATDWARRYDLFRTGPTEFIESSYDHLDVVLAAAREAGLRLIITLSNHWSDYGGIPMYLRWAGRSAEGLGFEDFYSDPRARAAYLAHLRKLLGRTNRLTGVRYVDDPTIFAWALMNESQVRTDAGAAARLLWVQEMARAIRALDPNHLISPGLLGYENLWERAEWLRVLRLPEVDFCDSHVYPQLSGGFDQLGPERAWPRLRDLLDDRAQLARHALRKPLVMGEFSFRTDDPRAWLGQGRAAWFSRVLDRQIHNGAAGTLVWLYEPFSGKLRDFGIYIDKQDTDDIRALLRARGQRLAGLPGPLTPRNPRLQATTGERPLYEPWLTLHGEARALSAWEEEEEGVLRLSVEPHRFALARFERAGAWSGAGALPHAYGADSGRFEYRFAAPAQAAGRAPEELRLWARLSSEWPGAGAPQDGGSPLRVLLDGREIARLWVVSDDGQGRIERLAVADPALLRGLGSGEHRLVFEVPQEPGARGLCIYGGPQPIELRYRLGRK